MSVDPSENVHQPSWRGAPIERLGLAPTTTTLLKQTGIIECQYFHRWSQAELEAWAAENRIYLSPILHILAVHGIQLAPNDRPDRLVRLVLAPASDASRQAAIQYYGLLGAQPRSLHAMGAENPTQQRLLERRIAEGRPRLSALTRLAPQLVLALNKAMESGSGDPAQLAAAIAPLLGDGKTRPAHFARLLLDVETPRVAKGPPASPSESRQDSFALPAVAVEAVELRPLLLETKATPVPTWVDAPIEHLGLRTSTTRRLQQAGILRCLDLTSWTKEQLDFWATENGVEISSLERALTVHAIPLAPGDQPDRLVRLYLAPLDLDQRLAVIEYYGLLDPAPENVKDLAAIYTAWHGWTMIDRARSRLQRLKGLPLPLRPVISAAAKHAARGPEKVASAIAPLLGRGQTVPLHFAHLLTRIVPIMRIQLLDEIQRQPTTPSQHELPTAPTNATRRQVERSRAASDLIDLLFNEDDA